MARPGFSIFAVRAHARNSWWSTRKTGNFGLPSTTRRFARRSPRQSGPIRDPRSGSTDREWAPRERARRDFVSAVEIWSRGPAPGDAVAIDYDDGDGPRKIRDNPRDGFPAAYEQPCPGTAATLTELGDDLALRIGEEVRRLTDDGAPEHAWTVDQARWLADSRTVLAGRVNHSVSPRTPVVDWLGPLEQVSWMPLLRTGSAPLPAEHILIDTDSGRRRRLPFDEWAGGAIVSASRPSDLPETLVYVHNARATVAGVLVVDMTNGACRALVREQSSLAPVDHRWLAARVEALSFELSVPDAFLWLSDGEGHSQLYLRRCDRGPDDPGIRLTHGPCPVERVLCTTADSVYVLARSDPDRPYDLHLCIVPLDGSGMRQLTTEPGEHQLRAVTAVPHFVDRHSSITRPPRTELLDAHGASLLVLEGADAAQLAALDWREPEEFTVLAGDGRTELRGVLYRPPDFDPAQRYPLIEVIYAGPQVASCPTSFDQSSYGAGSPGLRRAHHGRQAQALAQLGFVTFVLDGRGTPGRGRTFHEAVRGRMGLIEMDDHAGAVRQLAARYPFVDRDRVGVTGSSWGGYMTVRALLAAASTYHVGAAVAPVVDWYDHAAFIERIMGSPLENRANYQASSNLVDAHRLRGKLLLVHGTADVNATFSATMKLCHTFVEAGRAFDLCVIPGGTHQPTGHLSDYVSAVVARYLVEHLHPACISYEDIPFGSSAKSPRSEQVQ